MAFGGRDLINWDYFITIYRNIFSNNFSIILIDDSDIPRLKDILEQVISRASKVTRSFHQNAKQYEVSFFV